MHMRPHSLPRPRSLAVLALLGAAVAAGCSADSHANATPGSAGDSIVSTWDPVAESLSQARRVDSLSKIPGYVIDSAVPIPEAIRRFQAATPGERPSAFTAGAPSLDSLFDRYVRALDAEDTDAFGRLVMSRAEFAWLHYPESEYPDPPHELSPEFVWLFMDQNGSRGLDRALGRTRARGSRMQGVACAGPRAQGASQIWGPCTVTVRRDDGRTAELELVKSVIERDGRFKFVSFANGL